MANPYLEFKKKKEEQEYENPYQKFKNNKSSEKPPVGSSNARQWAVNQEIEQPTPDENTLPGFIGNIFDLVQRGEYALMNPLISVAGVLKEGYGKNGRGGSLEERIAFDKRMAEKYNLVEDVKQGITGEKKGSFNDIVEMVPRITDDYDIAEEMGQVENKDLNPYLKTGLNVATRAMGFPDILSQPEITEKIYDIGRQVTGAAKKDLPAFTESAVRGGVGLAGDIVLDPLDWVGFGLLNDVGKVATKLDDAVDIAKGLNNVDKLSDIDDPIKAIFKAGNIDEGSKLADQIKSVADNYGVDILEKGKTAAEQARKGQRGLINFGGETVVGGEKVFDIFNKVGDTVKQTDAYKSLGKKFDSRFGMPDELVDMEKRKDRILNIRKQDVIEKGKQYDDMLKDINVGGKDFTELVERGDNIEDAKVGELVDFFRKENDDLLRLEKEAGVPIQELQDQELNYFAHMLTEEAREKILKKYKGRPKEVITDILNKIEHGSTKGREYTDVTIKQINDLAKKGELPGYEDLNFGKFFEDDPVIVQSLRNLRSARARTNAEFLNDVAKRFGNAEKGEDITKRVQIYNPQFAKMLKGQKFEPEVADYLVNYAEKTAPENLQTFVRQFDKLQSLWKRSTLLPIPGFHVRNALDNAWKNFLGDVNLSSYADYIKLRNAGDIVTDAGQKISKERFDDLALEYGVVDTGLLMTHVTDALEKKLRKSDNILSKAGDTLREAGAFNENTFRQIHFLDKLKKGYTPQQAADSVAKYLFDYNDLTKFEKKTMKRLMPFYTFTRKNIPLQLKTMITEPGKLTRIPKAINAVESQSNQDVDESFLPDWIKNSASIQLPIGEDPSYFLLDNWISSMDLLNLTNPKEAVNTGVNMLSPFIKTPIELASNYDFFTQDNISDYPGERTDYLGYPVDNELLKAIQGMMPVARVANEIDRLNPGDVFGGDTRRPYQGEPSERWLRALTGLKSYDYDPESSQYFQQLESKNIYQEILNDIRKANDRGDEKMVSKLEELLKQFIEENTP